jgi:hypothetical protein
MKINANNRIFSLTAQEKGCKVVNVEFEFPTAVGIAGSKQRRRARAGEISAGLSERVREHRWIVLQRDSTRYALILESEMRFDSSQRPAKF